MSSPGLARARWVLAAVATCVLASGCPGPVEPSPPEWEWTLPEGFPAPTVPEDNPMTTEKVELGRRLFYDRRLSQNGEQSCASCHKQELAFTDGRATAVGSTGEHHRRNSMGLTNAGYNATFTWANPVIRTLEAQAMGPLFGEAPVELGWAGKETELVARLADDADYFRRFERSFPDEAEPVSVGTIVRALSAFQRTLISGNSPYDRWIYGGDSDAVSAEAKRGQELFFSERFDCFHCHGGFNFSDSVRHDGTRFDESPFHNTALYNVDGNGAYPSSDPGVVEITDKSSDMGRFRAPTLRNITVTAPFMHDGSAATLDDVIAHYARGGREILDGPNKGLGWMSPLKSEFVHGFTLTAQERVELTAFLESLKDDEFLTNPKFSDPFVQ